VFGQAVQNVKPMVEVKSRRVGGRQLPGAGRSAPGTARRAVDALDPRSGTEARRESMDARLAGELMEAPKAAAAP